MDGIFSKNLHFSTVKEFEAISSESSLLTQSFTAVRSIYLFPKDSLFVLGDNRNNSQDNRFFGFVDIKKVKSIALYLYWAKNKSRIAMELK